MDSNDNEKMLVNMTMEDFDEMGIVFTFAEATNFVEKMQEAEEYNDYIRLEKEDFDQFYVYFTHSDAYKKHAKHWKFQYQALDRKCREDAMENVKIKKNDFDEILAVARAGYACNQHGDVQGALNCLGEIINKQHEVAKANKHQWNFDSPHVIKTMRTWINHGIIPEDDIEDEQVVLSF